MGFEIGNGYVQKRDCRVFLFHGKSTTVLYDDTTSKTFKAIVEEWANNASLAPSDVFTTWKTADTSGKTIWTEVGVLEREGFSSVINEGNSVKTNTLGDVQLDVNSEVNIKQISPTADIANALVDNDGETMCILCLSLDKNKKDKDGEPNLAIIHFDEIINSNVNFVGGALGELMIKTAKEAGHPNDIFTPIEILETGLDRFPSPGVVEA